MCTHTHIETHNHIKINGLNNYWKWRKKYSLENDLSLQKSIGYYWHYTIRYVKDTDKKSFFKLKKWWSIKRWKGSFKHKMEKSYIINF